MSNLKKYSRGITLVSLVITIIILLILAGISIAQLTGSGLLLQTQQVATNQIRAAEEEAIRLVNYQLFMDKELNSENITAETVKAKIDGEVSVIQKNGEVFIITFIKTGNVYELNMKDAKVIFLGKHSGDYSDEEIIPQDIKFVLNPEGWTNGNVITTIKVNENISMADRKLQWTKTPLVENSWQDYKDTVQIISTKNEEIYARVYEEITGNYTIAQINIQSIDKEKPVIKDIKTTTNTLTFIATDDSSGIIGYAITETSEEPENYESCSNTKKLEVTSKDKKQETSYYIWVKDEAGNVSRSEANKTGSVGNLTEANTIFEYNPKDWTRGSVKVTASTREDTTNYTLRITKSDLKSLSSQEILKLPLGSQGIEVDTNNTTVYAILVDDAGQIGSAATATVDKIDKNAPTINSLVQGETTTSSIEVFVTAVDTQSGIDKYRYSSDGGITWSEYTTSSSYKLENLTKGLGCSYSIIVEVTDKVGNVTTKKQEMATTNDNDYYVDTKDKLLCSMMDEEYKKTDNNPAIMAVVYIDEYRTPLLVSTSSSAVEYYTTGHANSISAGGSINYKGTTYYYSSVEMWKQNYSCYKSSFTTLNNISTAINYSTYGADGVKMLLDRYFYDTSNKNYEVCYDVSDSSDRQMYSKGSTVKITNNNLTKDGYHFLGWSTGSDSTTAEYLSGNSYNIDGSITLYVVWQKHDFSDQTGICTICKEDMNYLTASNGGENWNSGQILNYASGFNNAADCCRSKFNGSWNLHSSCNLCQWAFDNSGGIGSASDYSDTDGNVCMIIYKNLIDVTNIEKIIFKCQLDENASILTNKTKIGLCSSNSLSKASDYYNFQQSTEVTDNTMSAATYVLELDLSNFTGDYYLKVTTERAGGKAQGSTVATKINSMYPIYK